MCSIPFCAWHCQIIDVRQRQSSNMSDILESITILLAAPMNICSSFVLRNTVVSTIAGPKVVFLKKRVYQILLKRGSAFR